MRILQVIGVLNRGGAETLLMNVFRNVDRTKYKFDFLVFKNEDYPYSEEIKKLGGNIYCIESPKQIGIVGYVKNVKKLCLKNHYDVIHSHTLYNCGPTVFAGFLAGVKTRISHCHSSRRLDKGRQSVKKEIYYHLSKILINLFSTDKIACGKEAGKLLFWGNKYSVIKNGINIKTYRFSSDKRKKIRSMLKISDDVVVLGHIGRFVYIKNQEYLLDIVEKLINDHNMRVKLLMIGDGEMKNDIRRMVKKRKLSNSVIIMDGVNNVFEYYNAMDIFVFPSLFEGVPMTLIEAQANGLKIIASEKISRECNITGKITFLPIEKKSIDLWVNEIVSAEISHHDYYDKIKTEGYLIEDTVTKIIDKYNGE